MTRNAVNATTSARTAGPGGFIVTSTGRNRIISQGERVNFGEFKTDGQGYNPEQTHKRVNSATDDLHI